MGEIILIRGVHRNELAAFEMARKVRKQIAAQAACRLVTIPRKETMWEYFDNWTKYYAECAAQTPPPDAHPEIAKVWADKLMYERYTVQTGGGLDYEFRGRNARKNEIYSFHNYPVRLDFRRSIRDVDNPELDPEKIGKYVYVGETKTTYGTNLPHSTNLAGEVEICLLQCGGVLLELPAVFKQTPEYQIPLRYAKQGQYNVSPDVGYFYNVDIPKTREAGLLSGELAASIARCILENHNQLQRPLRKESRQASLFDADEP